MLRLLCALALAAAPVFTSAASTDAATIVRFGEEHLRGKSLQALMTMTIVRPTFTRELKLRVWTSGKTKALVEILQPAKETGIASLRADDQMWNFLPKTDQIVRVPTSLMLQSWMGSDFTNDDLMKMSSLADDYFPRRLREEKGTTVLELTPKPNSPVVWGKILYWARGSDRLPVREEFYDERGRLVRTLVLEEFRQIDDRVVPLRWTISKAGSDEKTTVVYERLLYDRILDDRLFSRDHLKSVAQAGRSETRGWVTQAFLATPRGTR
jgi:outer membrane lipoprotein-sorting protein